MDNRRLTYCDRFEQTAKQFSDKIAVQIMKGDNFEGHTYADLLTMVKNTSYHLAQEGIEKGDRIALMAENHPLWAVAYLGSLCAGAIVVPLDTQLGAEGLYNLLQDSGSKLIFTTDSLIARVKQSADRLAQPLKVVSLHAKEPAEGIIPFESFYKSDALPENGVGCPISLEDTAAILYTSGTTGNPKGVMLSHGQIIAELDGVLSYVDASDKDSMFCILPLFHIYAQVMNFLLPLAIGAQITYIDSLKSADVLRAMQEAGITAFGGVPQIFYLFHKKIFDEVRAKPRSVQLAFKLLLALSGLIKRATGINAGKVFFKQVHRAFGGKIRYLLSGGSSFDVKVASDFDKLGFTILQGYGLTETAAAATLTPPDRNKIGSVGLPLPGVEIKIVEPDENGIGEIALRGPVVTKGYYNKDELTGEVIRDGWFYTGDLGYRDRDGNLYITGRKKDVIVLSNGKNIYPEEIENHYSQSPYIKEMCVLGIADPSDYEKSEKLHAVIVPDFDYLKAQKIANAQEAIRFDLESLSAQLPSYKRILSYEIRTEPLPRTTTRKIKRFELKKHLDEGGAGRGPTKPLTAYTPTPEDERLLATDTAQSIISFIAQASKVKLPVNLGMNLELDLEFDSLSRIELIASLESMFNIEMPEETVAQIHTVRDLVVAINDLIIKQGGAIKEGPRTAQINWGAILSSAQTDEIADAYILKPKRFTAVLAFVILKLLYVAFKILFRIETRGMRNLNLETPFLICPNHQSIIDPVLLSSALPYRVLSQIFFVGASEYWSGLLGRMAARMLNIVPVDAETNLLRAMKVGAIGLRNKKALVIYPEGTRTADGQLKEFKKGSAILAKELGAPIVPVAIKGAFEVLPRGTRRIRLNKVRIAFGEPIRVDSVYGPAREISDDEKYRLITQRLRERVEDLFTRL